MGLLFPMTEHGGFAAGGSGEGTEDAVFGVRSHQAGLFSWGTAERVVSEACGGGSSGRGTGKSSRERAIVLLSHSSDKWSYPGCTTNTSVIVFVTQGGRRSCSQSPGMWVEVRLLEENVTKRKHPLSLQYPPAKWPRGIKLRASPSLALDKLSSLPGYWDKFRILIWES